MSHSKEIRGVYISCQQELFPCVEQYCGVVPKRFRTLLLIEMVCVKDHLPRPRPRSVVLPAVPHPRICASSRVIRVCYH